MDDFDDEFNMDMAEIEADTVGAKSKVKMVPRTYLMQTSGWNTNVEEDQNITDVAEIKKLAAKKAVKCNGGKVYIYQLVGEVEQTNYEALVESRTIPVPEQKLVLDQPKED